MYAAEALLMAPLEQPLEMDLLASAYSIYSKEKKTLLKKIKIWREFVKRPLPADVPPAASLGVLVHN